MKAFPWLSDTLRRLNPRERRVVLGGVLVSATALAIVLLGLPLLHSWAVREQAYAASREEWLRLATLVANTDRLRRTLDERQRAHAADEARLVTGATSALAASALQGLLQRYADESSVQLNRVDVASQPRPDRPGLLAIPVQLQCQGDIYGLVDFLSRLEQGEKLLAVDELSLNAAVGVAFGPSVGPHAGQGPGPRVGPRVAKPSQYLSWSLRLHGLYRAVGGAIGS
jgi:type II secretory pathway component PulM